LTELDVLERAVLFSDTWAAVMVGGATLHGLLTLATGLTDLDEPSTWSVIGQAIGMIDRIANDEERAELGGVVRRLYQPVLHRLTWNPTAGESEQAGELRGMVVEMLGIYGHDSDVIAEALRRFDANEVSGDLARALVMIAADQHRPGTSAILDERRKSATTPQDEQRYLFALAGIPSEAVALETLEKCLSEFRSQDAPFLMGAMVANRSIGEFVWRWITERWGQLTEHFIPDMHAMMLGGVVTLFKDGELAREVRAFHESNPLQSRHVTLIQMLDRLERGVLFGERVRGTLLETLKSLN